MGQEAQEILDNCAKWTERMYDMDDEEIEKYIDSHGQDCNSIVYIEYQYYQVGKDEKWLQEQVEKVLIRHKSILDITTKLNEYATRINRAVAKSVTSCGCIEIHATKQNYDKDSLHEIKDNMMSINSSAFGDGYYLRSVNHSKVHYLYKAGRFCGTIHAVPDINDVDQELMNNYIVLR